MQIKKDSILDLSVNYIIDGCYVEITSDCNMRCLHCYNESGTKHKLMDLPAFINAISSVPNDKEDSSITISGGEPLLHPLVWDFIRITMEKNVGKALIITNASLITREIAKRLVESKIGVQVSLNGSCAETHDKLCGQGNFDKTMRGIELLLEEGYQDNIHIRFMVSEFNKNDVVPFIYLMISKGIKAITIATLSIVGRASEHLELLNFTPIERERVSILIKEAISEFNKNGMNINFASENFSGGCPLISNVTEGESKIPLSPRIDPWGNVYLCQLFTGEEYAFGNVNQDNLLNIIQGPDFSRFVWFLRFGLEYVHDCYSCIWKSTCGKGCAAMVLNSGSVQGTDGDCYFRKKAYLTDFLKNTISSQ